MTQAQSNPNILATIPNEYGVRDSTTHAILDDVHERGAPYDISGAIERQQDPEVPARHARMLAFTAMGGEWKTYRPEDSHLNRPPKRLHEQPLIYTEDIDQWVNGRYAVSIWQRGPVLVTSSEELDRLEQVYEDPILHRHLDFIAEKQPRKSDIGDSQVRHYTEAVLKFRGDNAAALRATSQFWARYANVPAEEGVPRHRLSRFADGIVYRAKKSLGVRGIDYKFRYNDGEFGTDFDPAHPEAYLYTTLLNETGFGQHPPATLDSILNNHLRRKNLRMSDWQHFHAINRLLTDRHLEDPNDRPEKSQAFADAAAKTLADLIRYSADPKNMDNPVARGMFKHLIGTTEARRNQPVIIPTLNRAQLFEIGTISTRYMNNKGDKANPLRDLDSSQDGDVYLAIERSLALLNDQFKPDSSNPKKTEEAMQILMNVSDCVLTFAQLGTRNVRKAYQEEETRGEVVRPLDDETGLKARRIGKHRLGKPGYGKYS